MAAAPGGAHRCDHRVFLVLGGPAALVYAVLGPRRPAAPTSQARPG